MSLFDDASLVYIPTGYKATKNYSGKPSTGGADMTFSRASGATRVNSKGLVEKVRTNQLNYSNTFNGTGWTIQDATLTSGQSGYDGTSNAWKLTESATTAEHYVRQTPSVSGLLTISIYAKANTRDWLYLRGVTGSVNVRAWFDLQNGVVGTTNGSVLSRSIQSVGGGWYRCSMTLNHQSGFECYFGISNADGVVNYAGDGTSSIYIQDAQLEYGLVATNYIETTSATVSVGPVNDEPRLTYDPVNPTAPSLLMEPQRTNALAYSEYFSAWSLSGGTLTANATTSPDGYQNAYLYTEDTSTNYHRFNTGTSASSSDKVYSVYAKWAGGGGNKWLTVDNGPTAWFDIENGVVGSTQGSVQTSIEYVGDGWYRCIYHNPLSTTGGIYIGIASSNGGAGNHLGNGQPAFYAYGAQCEDAVTYPTSYIPTNGTSVTRVADTSSKTGISDLIGQTEGTLFLDFIWNGLGTASVDNPMFSIGLQEYGTSNIAIANYNGALYGRVTVSTTIEANIAFGAMVAGTRYKAALAYANNDVIFYVNGLSYGSDTSVSIPATSSAYLQNAYPNAKNVNKALLFPTRLDNATLATLTSL